MFRIPDYVANNRLDTGAQPNVHVDDSIGRNVTRLGVAFGTAGDSMAVRQRRAAALRQAQDRLEAERREQARPLTADERRLHAHRNKRQVEAAGFRTEQSYHALQRQRDAMEAEARAESGPSGEGFTALYERKLGLDDASAFTTASADPVTLRRGSGGMANTRAGLERGQTAQPGQAASAAALPDGLPPDLIAGIGLRADADRERRLAKASADEVQMRRNWTRAELGQMQSELLADLAKEPDRYDEILDQGTEFVIRNTLPDAEKVQLLDAWQRQAQKTLADRLADTEDPQTLRVMFGFVPAGASSQAVADGNIGAAGARVRAGADANANETAGADRTGTSSTGTSRTAGPGSAPAPFDPASVEPPPIDLEDIIFHPAFLTGDDETLRRELGLAEPLKRFAGFAVRDGVAAIRTAEKRLQMKHDRAAIEMEMLLKQDAVLIVETGQGVTRLTYKDIEATLGKKRADQWRLDRLTGPRLHRVLAGIETLSDPQIEQRIEAERPKPGAADTEIRSIVYRSARRKADAIINLRRNDPVAAVAGKPGLQALLDAHRDDPAAVSGQQLAAALFKAQAEAHIPAFRRTIFRPGEAEAIMAPILALEGEARQAAVNSMAAGFIEIYGPYADEVMASLVPHLAGDRPLYDHAVRTVRALEDMVSPSAQETALTNIRRRTQAVGLATAGASDGVPEAAEPPDFATIFQHQQLIRRAHVALVRDAAATDPSQPTAFAGYSDAELARLYSYIDQVKDEPKLKLGRDYLQKGLPTPGETAIRYLRDHPDTLLHFIETFGADQVPPGFTMLPQSAAELMTRLQGDNGSGAVNPYPLIVRAQLALATEIDAGDRFGLNNAEAFGNTLAGAGEAALAVETTDRLPPGHPEATFGRGRIIAFTEEVAGMIRDAEGFGEGAAGLGGSFLGSSSSPEALVGPLRLVGPGRTAASRVGNAALSGALAEGVADPAVQALRIRAGLQEDYEPGRTVSAILFGIGVPPALEGLAQVYRRAKAEVGTGFPLMPAISSRDGRVNSPGLIRKFKARRNLARYKMNADRIFAKATARDYFAPVWDRLTPDVQAFLEKRYRNFSGLAGENIFYRDLDDAGFNFLPENREFELPAGFKTESRKFDNATSEELKLILNGFFAVPRKVDGIVGIEKKVNNSKYSYQKEVDEYLIREKKIAAAELLRIPATEIPPGDLADVLFSWLEKRKKKTNPGGVPKQDIEDLIRVLREESGPDGRRLTIGQVSLAVLATTLPLLYPDDAE